MVSGIVFAPLAALTIEAIVAAELMVAFTAFSVVTFGVGAVIGAVGTAGYVAAKTAWTRDGVVKDVH